MPVIVPAILEENIDSFEDKLSAVLKIPNVSRIHIDFSDGVFTPHKILGINEIGTLNPAYFWEAHLLLENPEKYFFDAKLAGFNSVIIPFEAVGDHAEFSKMASELRDYKIAPALGLNPETAVEQAFPHIGLFEHILLLSVDPGYQGMPFKPEVYERLAKLKAHSKNVKIEVDGAVGLGNIRSLAEAGADFLVVGSGLFVAGNNAVGLPSSHGEVSMAQKVAQNFEKLQAEIKNL